MTNTFDTEALLQQLLNKSRPRSQQSIRERMEYWREVANNPGKYTKDGDQNNFAIAARRKVAIQSLKRLVARNPEIAKAIHSETPQETR